MNFLEQMRSQDAFWSELGSIWAAKSSQMGGQKGPQRFQKRDQNDIEILIDFWIDFGAIWEAQEMSFELRCGMRGLGLTL